MQKLLLTTGIAISLISSSFLHSKNYLENRLSPNDKRASTFQKCFELLEARNAKTLVETGTSRKGCKNCAGDGCSTALFADWANDHIATLYSVDIDPNAIRRSNEAIMLMNKNVEFRTHDSISFLQNFGKRIDFLYLDSYDFEFDNPTPSQMHHLYEIQAALPYLHKDSVVMIDDCDLPHGGKGKLAIEYLKSHGWKVLLENYQTILVYPQ